MATPLASYVPQVRRVLWLTLGVNIAVVLVKVAIGLASSSLAILSDAAHSAVDGLNNLVGLVIMSFVRPHADPEHPYGHGKFEVVGAMAIAAFMLITFYEIVTRAVERLVAGGAAAQLTFADVLLFSLTLIGNAAVVWYETREGRRLGSQLLIADSRHTSTDIAVTIGVIIGLLLVAAGFAFMDAVISLVVAGFVALAAYRVVADAVPVLVDQAVHDLADIEGVAESVPGVIDAHDVRTRGTGAECFIELNIDVSTASLRAAHQIADQVEEALQQRFGSDCVITVHMEPQEGGRQGAGGAAA